MAEMSGDSVSEGRLDLVPMIDCIMLLLLFFMLTTKFNPEEKAVKNLLPTDKGMMASTPTKVDPPKTVNVLIYPKGIERGLPHGESTQAADRWIKNLASQSRGGIIQDVVIRVGNRKESIELTVNQLGNRDPKLVEPHVNRVHAFIGQELNAYEIQGKSRKDQPEIVIHCFSSLSWQFALVTYDAIRSYEITKDATAKGMKVADLQNSRAINFAPPRIRNYHVWELGNELYEIIHSQ